MNNIEMNFNAHDNSNQSVDINYRLMDLTIENIRLKDENKRLKEQLECYINNDDCPAEHWLFRKMNDV